MQTVKQSDKILPKTQLYQIYDAYTTNVCTLQKKTRTKTSIRYAKENDREKRERRKERERKVKGEI